MNIESLGEGKIDLLFEKGLIKNIADLYDLSYEQLLGLEKTVGLGSLKERKISFQEKTVRNILQGVESSKSVPFERVVFALGISNVGETVAKKLARHFKTMHALASATIESLISVNEIGEVIAESVVSYFLNEQNRVIVDRLRDKGLQMEIRKDKYRNCLPH